jgi:hypothetical protein
VLIQQQVPLQLDAGRYSGEVLQMQRGNFVRSAAEHSQYLDPREVGTGKNALASAIHNASRWHMSLLFSDALRPMSL